MGTDATPENKCCKCGIGDPDHCGWCGSQTPVPAAHNGVEGELLSEGIKPTHPVIDELIVSSEKYLTTSQRVDAERLRHAIDAARSTYGGEK